jgi:peptidoglycan/LPS O-acetylase OafA/YrhL
MPAKGTDARGRLTGLEALRFACAFGVLLFHYHQFAFEPRTGFVLSSNRALPFSRALEVFYANGSFAVPVFWCISGFIFFWKYQAQIARRTVGFSLLPLHS